jgi:FkbM family methyltransferase
MVCEMNYKNLSLLNKGKKVFKQERTPLQGMSRLRSIIKESIPDGKFKDFLRCVNQKTHLKFLYDELSLKRLHKPISTSAYTIAYSPANNTFFFTFKQGNLHNHQLLFPDTDLKWLYHINKEMRGYFATDCLKPGMLVIDAGAYPGDFSILAAQKGCSVIALEPDPWNRSYLEETIKANNASDRVRVLDSGLSDSVGEASMLLKGNGSQLIKEKELPNHKKEKVITVKTTTLDTLLEKEGFFSPSNKKVFVKMDVEGHELNALAGGRRTMAYGADFAIACYHLVNGKPSHVYMSKEFQSMNYNVKLVNPPHLTLIAQPPQA